MADEEITPEDATDEAFHELSVSSVELLVNVGIISSIRTRWPDEVQENFLAKLRETNEYLHDLTGEFQQFAGAYDG